MAQDTTTYETILVDRSDEGVVTVTLNRPDKRNAMNPTMHFEMGGLLDELAHDPDAKVLVITGAGKSFCAGQDLKEYFAELADNPVESARARAASEWRTAQLRLFPKPTIAAVNGFCFGGAFSIVASCDIVLSADEATYGLSEINFGKIAGGYVSWAISQIMNPRDTMYYVLTGETFDGKKAAEMKLATKSVPLAELEQATAELASKLAAKNPVVASASKEALKQAATMTYEQAGPWLKARSKALDFESGATWRKGVEQFQDKSFKPGLGDYKW